MRREWTESAVLQALSDSAPLHITDLVEHVDEHPVTVDQACARLHDDGYIFPTGHGIYDITERGHRRLDQLMVKLEEH